MMAAVWCYVRNCPEWPVSWAISRYAVSKCEQMKTKWLIATDWQPKWYLQQFVINVVLVSRSCQSAGILNSSCALWQHNTGIQVECMRAMLSDLYYFYVLKQTIFSPINLSVPACVFPYLFSSQRILTKISTRAPLAASLGPIKAELILISVRP